MLSSHSESDEMDAFWKSSAGLLGNGIARFANFANSLKSLSEIFLVKFF